MIKNTNIFDDMFSMIDAMFKHDAPVSVKTGACKDDDHYLTSGLKKILSKPHNLYVVRDKETNEIKFYRIDICYTPFKKSDVKVSIRDKALHIKIGSENMQDEEGLVYKNISSQRSNLKLALIDTDIDISAITAKCEDGILTVILPRKERSGDEDIDIPIE